MSDGTYNLCINQYATFMRIFQWKAGQCCGVPVGSSPLPVDLTGYTAMMQIRAFPLDATVLYDASSNITLGGVNGTISLLIPASTTSGFTWWDGFYDLLLTNSGGFVTRLLSGTVTVSPGVTP